MNSFEQQPGERSELRAALRKLIVENVTEVQDRNQQHVDFFRQMQTDASDFAQEMHSQGVRAEVGYEKVQVEPDSFWKSPTYQRQEHSVWKLKYQDHNETEYIKESFVVLASGKLIVADMFDNMLTSAELNTIYQPGDFINRTIFDDPEAVQKAKEEWLGRLEATARYYARVNNYAR